MCAVRDRDGEYQLTALPADNDPLMGRIRNIRERDFMFIDTVQDYFATYVRQMRLPYDSWREQSYQETITLRELEASARRRFIAGAAAVVGGIAAASNGGNWATQAGGATAVGAGAFLVKSGFDKQAEARIHMQALEELGESLENAVASQVINLDDRTITLSGSVEEQYGQWRDILADLYAAEMGELLQQLVPGLQPLRVISDACANCTTPTGQAFIGCVAPGLLVAPEQYAMTLAVERSGKVADCVDNYRTEAEAVEARQELDLKVRRRRPRHPPACLPRTVGRRV